MKSFRNGLTASKYKVVPFEREAGYYLQKGMSYYQKNKLNKALMHFRKAVEVEPGNAYNHYNLACLLSKLGRLKEANRIFNHILSELDETLADCYFLLAINYGLMEDMNKSREYLERYLQADPEGDMVLEAMELLDALDEGVVSGEMPAYADRDLVLESVLRSDNEDELSNLFATNISFRRSLSNHLYQGSDEFKEDILRFYGTVGGEAASIVLRDFIKNPWIKERFRQLALLELKKLGQSGSVQVFVSGEIREMDLESCPDNTPVWREEWQQVVDCAMENMRRSNCYDDGFFDDVQAIWFDYINTAYPHVPRITKRETWAAALEYSLARFHFLNLTQKELAEEYGISAGSVSNRFKEINTTLNIDQKAYKNMISYLKRDR